MTFCAQVDQGVASGAGLGLAMRLFDLEGFEILYEEKLQTKVPFSPKLTCKVLILRLKALDCAALLACHEICLAFCQTVDKLFWNESISLSG